MPRDRRRGLTTQSNVGKPISTQLLFVGSDTNRSLHATGCWSSCQDRPVEVEAHKWPSPDEVRKVWDNLITAAASGALQLLIGGIEARAVPRTNAVRLPTTPQGRRTRAIRFPPSGQRRLRRREATDADNYVLAHQLPLCEKQRGQERPRLSVGVGQQPSEAPPPKSAPGEAQP